MVGGRLLVDVVGAGAGSHDEFQASRAGGDRVIEHLCRSHDDGGRREPCDRVGEGCTGEIGLADDLGIQGGEAVEGDLLALVGDEDLHGVASRACSGSVPRL